MAVKWPLCCYRKLGGEAQSLLPRGLLKPEHLALQHPRVWLRLANQRLTDYCMLTGSGSSELTVRAMFQLMALTKLCLCRWSVYAQWFNPLSYTSLSRYCLNCQMWALAEHKRKIHINQSVPETIYQRKWWPWTTVCPSPATLGVTIYSCWVWYWCPAAMTPYCANCHIIYII